MIEADASFGFVDICSSVGKHIPQTDHSLFSMQ